MSESKPKVVPFPKEAIEKWTKTAELDEAMFEELVEWSEYANARIKELEAVCNELGLKIQMVVRCLR